MVMNSTNHWTEVFYKELQDAEEYESSLAQAISPDKNRDALSLNKETRLINRVESKQESNPIQKVKATFVQQKSVEETINCDFSVDSFPSERSVKDTTKENRHATLGEKVSDRTKTPKQGKSSSTKIDEEQRVKRAIPKQNVDIRLTKPRKEKLKERFEKGSSAKLSSQEMATKCTTAIQTSDVAATNPQAPVAIEIFKEKAEYRVLSVSKSSPDKKAKPSAVYLASPTKKVHLNHQSNMIQDDVLCSKSKECHDPIKHNQSLGPLDEPMGTYDEYSCCTSNCSSVHVDTLLPVSNSCLPPRHGSSMTSSTATFDANGIGRTVSDRKNVIFSADHQLQSSIAKKSKGKEVENSCDQSIVSVLSEPTLHHEIECHDYYHPEQESLVDHANGILLDQEDASSFLSRLRKKTSSPHSTTKISDKYLLPEDYSINTSFCDVLYDDAAPIEDEISMALTRECSVESWRSSKLLDEMKKNIERTRAALENAKRIRKRE